MTALEAPTKKPRRPRRKVTHLAMEATLRLAAEPSVGKVFWAMQTNDGTSNNWPELIQALLWRRRKGPVFKDIVLEGLRHDLHMKEFVATHAAEIGVAFPRMKKLGFSGDRLADGIGTMMSVAASATSNQYSFVLDVPVVSGVARVLLTSHHGWAVDISCLVAVLADMDYSSKYNAISTRWSGNFIAEMQAFLARFGVVVGESRHIRLPFRSCGGL